MIYRIYYQGVVKFITPVKNREELMELRNSKENLELLAKARTGDQKAKGRLLQLAYNLGRTEGKLAGCESIGSYFFHDVDCYDPEQSAAIKELVLSKKDAIGLMMLEKSPGGGWHLVCRREPGTTILESQVKVANELRIEMDTNAKNLNRVVFSTSGSEEDLPYLDDALFDEPMTAEECVQEYQRLKEREKKGLEQVPKGAKKADKHYRPWEDCSLGSGPKVKNCSLGSGPEVKSSVTEEGAGVRPESAKVADATSLSRQTRELRQTQSEENRYPNDYHGIPFAEILKKYWEVNNNGFEPTEGDRDTLTFQLALDFRHICGKNFGWLDQVIPCYDGFPVEEKRQKIRNALNSELESFPSRLRNTLNALEKSVPSGCLQQDEEQMPDLDPTETAPKLPKMPQGIRDSIDAVGTQLALPVLTAVCPCIGALATGVKLDVHGKMKGLNLIAYIAGDSASRKGDIDPVVFAWMSEVMAVDKMYERQEDDWRVKKRAAKNQKNQPEEPKLPIRFVPLNNTVANLAERLANVEGKHAFSFTPEADTVAQKWKSSMSDFSIMLRQSYDGSRYDREARSPDAVNVHIEHLLWNVTMCGTPDALFRVVTNYTDGLQSRIALARTPDNTFSQLEEQNKDLTPRQEERIIQIAHLLPLMQGEVVLPKLEQQGRLWLEKIRIETMKNDDRVKARQRFRICVTTQRMVCCLMLCKVCETLIQKHGLNGAENQLKQNPSLWKEMLLKTQTPSMLEAYDVIADSLMENALYFFRDRIEQAFNSRNYVGCSNGERQRHGKNDTIYERLEFLFTYEQAMQQTVAVKGTYVTPNIVRQMLKNWRKQGLIVQTDEGKFRKL